MTEAHNSVMSKPILYGSLQNPPVRACLLTAAAIDLDFEFREVNLYKKENLTDDFLNKNPQHTIPVLEVDNEYICDSHAINAYLVDKYAKDDTLYPKDLLKRAVINERLHFDSGVLFTRTSAINVPIIKHTRTTLPKKLVEELNESLDVLEKFLTKTKYVAGNTMSIADFSIISTMTAATALVHLSSDKHSKIINWIKEMESLPYYAANCGIPGKKLAEHIRNSLALLQNDNVFLTTHFD